MSADPPANAGGVLPPAGVVRGGRKPPAFAGGVRRDLLNKFSIPPRGLPHRWGGLGAPSEKLRSRGPGRFLGCGGVSFGAFSWGIPLSRGSGRQALPARRLGGFNYPLIVAVSSAGWGNYGPSPWKLKGGGGGRAWGRDGCRTFNPPLFFD
jgi:hypothetical protein